MKILFLTDNFPPEGNAPATRTYEHAKYWVNAGNSVTVITCAPNFPEGKLYDGYKNAWYKVEYMDGIKVVRVKSYITANAGFVRRTLDFMSFMVTSFVAGLFQQRPDVIIGTSPQFFTVCSAWMLSVFRRRPFVFELRDLWPASIKAVGAMKDSVTLTLLEKLEMFLYKRAALIVSVTNTFKSELVARGIDPEKIAVVINGVDLTNYTPRKKDQHLVEQYDLTGKFVIGYIGTHGMAHALYRVLEAAQRLQAIENIVILMVGSGANKEELIAQANSMGLKNVMFLSRQPKELMPNIWSICDLSLIPLKNDPLFSSVIPSKIFESMGMGLPIVLALPAGEASQIITETGAGIIVPPEDSERLADAIIELVNDKEKYQALAKASASAALNYNRENQADKMFRALKNIVN